MDAFETYASLVPCQLISYTPTRLAFDGHYRLDWFPAILSRYQFHNISYATNPSYRVRMS